MHAACRAKYLKNGQACEVRFASVTNLRRNVRSQLRPCEQPSVPTNEKTSNFPTGTPRASRLVHSIEPHAELETRESGVEYGRGQRAEAGRR